MYPYDRWWRWHLHGRGAHLIAATEGRLDWFAEPYRHVLHVRARGLARALKTRRVFVVLVSLSYLVTAAAWVARFLPFFDDVQGLVQRVAGIVSGVTGVLTIVVLGLTRYVGQLEADLMSGMALGAVARTRKVQKAMAEEAARRAAAGPSEPTPGRIQRLMHAIRRRQGRQQE